MMLVKPYSYSVILLLILFFTGSSYTVLAQKDTVRIKDIILNHQIIDNDTIPHITLKEVPVMPPFKFKSKRQKRRYSKLVHNVKITLPYARRASYTINDINSNLALITEPKERKKYLKQREKELFEEFETPLKKLTFSQGKLLIKLINRETGDTTYELIKEYKGGVSAVFWQGIARLFGSNLKSEFDSDGDDVMIEHIILLIDNGMI
ncbi:DUF4294 domain-containing protein [Carboxylicivirga caseinilyticus]|uniref:DUF4294 domain-containing protein n=1 Tax=Carboxylicivirga caseinilyticus TaxID=3417572 RepID=UPI003D342983|nr:DUF4294 domain-containing protein [Marinilabiliaceae bacterium A049]